MSKRTGTVARSIAGALALAFLAGPAAAGGLKDEPAPSGRMLEWSASFAVTSDYVFRGFSQTGESPAAQATLDATYGILYGGVFVSNLDFGETFTGRDVAVAELTFVAGIKPTWGPVSFDFGVIYYTYPGARDSGAELNFLELKAGASVEPWKGGTIGVTGYYSPEYTGEIDDVWTVEGAFAQVLPQMHTVTPTFSAVIGYQTGDSAGFAADLGDGDDYFWYWNAGVSLAFHERFSLDLRYWGTNLSSGFCDAGPVFNCSDRFVATAKVTY